MVYAAHMNRQKIRDREYPDRQEQIHWQAGTNSLTGRNKSTDKQEQIHWQAGTNSLKYVDRPLKSFFVYINEISYPVAYTSIYALFMCVADIFAIFFMFNTLEHFALRSLTWILALRRWHLPA